MIIPVELGVRSIARVSNSKLLLPEKVELEFTSSIYSLGVLVVTVKIENDLKRFKTLGEPIDVSSLCTKAGVLDISVSMFRGTEPIKTWRVEPIYLKEVEHGFEAVPEIVELREEIAKIKIALTEIATLIKTNEMI